MTFELVEKVAEVPVKKEGASVQSQGTLENPGYKSRDCNSQLRYPECSLTLTSGQVHGKLGEWGLTGKRCLIPGVDSQWYDLSYM